MKYKQKAIEVDARQFTSSNGVQIAAWIVSKGAQATHYSEQIHKNLRLEERLYTSLLPESQPLAIGDWIVETDGNFTFFTEKEFAKRFEEIK